MKHIWIIVVTGLVLTLIPTSIAQAVPVATVSHQLTDCAEYGGNGHWHHILAPWTEQAVLSGDFRAWKTGSTIVIAFRVAECGGKWMFAKFTDNSLTTNFFPDRGWSYVVAQVRGWTLCAKRVIVAAVQAAAVASYSVETVIGFILLPPDVCSLPGSWRLPECGKA